MPSTESILRVQLAAAVQELAAVKAAITDVLEGEPLDEFNRNDNGLNWHPDLKYIERRLRAALQEGE